MGELFTPVAIHNLTLPNRIIRSATWEGMADDDGNVGPQLVNFYRELAQGGLGLIITGYAYIRPDGKGLPRQIGAYNDEQIKGLASIAKAIHDEGSLAFVQIVHAGGQTSTKTTGQIEVLAPSSVYYPSNDVTPRELSLDELPGLMADFADAARRVKEAGFDGVQLHGAHGYLVNRFLSPASNLREDEYGGSPENRARFAVEIIQAMRKCLGDDFPISVKLNAEDFEEGGLQPADALIAANLLVNAGIDHLEISGGTPAAGKLGASRLGINNPEKEAYFRTQAAEIKAAISSIPVGVVGGIRSYDVAESLIANGEADTVSLARPLICEPHLAKRWQQGDHAPAKCLSDSRCFVAGLKGGIQCTTAKQKPQEG